MSSSSAEPNVSVRRAFASLRFGPDGAKKEANLLKEALARRGVELFVAAPHAGESITDAVFSKIDKSELFIAFATKSYGEDTGNPACTLQELDYWRKYMMKKFPDGLVPIDMLKPGEEHQFYDAKMLFSTNTMYEVWQLGEPMPTKLPEKILDAMVAAPIPTDAAAFPSPSPIKSKEPSQVQEDREAGQSPLAPGDGDNPAAPTTQRRRIIFLLAIVVVISVVATVAVVAQRGLPAAQQRTSLRPSWAPSIGAAVPTTTLPLLRPSWAPSTNPTIPREWVRRGDDLDGEAADDRSGRSVALSSNGTILAVGAPFNDGASNNAGHVRVYAWNATAAEWVQRGGDLYGEATRDNSGWSVALSSDGTVLAVGAPYNDSASVGAGHVRVYAWNATAAEWVQRGDDLDGEAACDVSGWSVDLSSDGTILAVGARYNDGANDDAGHMRVYAWNAPATEWVQRGDDLDGEAANDGSGRSVALSGDGTVIAVGAPSNDGAGNDAGHVRVYAWDAPAAEWFRRGDDLDGKAAYHQSGFSVALSSDGTFVAVGAPGAGVNAGHVRVYGWDAPAAEWVQRGDDLDGEDANDESGRSVALSSDGTVVAVGAPWNNNDAGFRAGHMRVYAWNAPAAEWVQRGDDLDGEAANDESGTSVALSSDGTVLVVGAHYNDGAGNNAGHARVYSWEVANTA